MPKATCVLPAPAGAFTFLGRFKTSCSACCANDHLQKPWSQASACDNRRLSLRLHLLQSIHAVCFSRFPRIPASHASSVRRKSDWPDYSFACSRDALVLFVVRRQRYHGDTLRFSKSRRL